jgi:hypothetical protein
MCGERIVMKERKVKPSYLGRWLLVQGCEPQPVLVPCSGSTDTVFIPAQSLAWPQTSPFPHFSARLSPLPGPKYLLFPHPIHTCEGLTDNDDINMLDFTSIGGSGIFYNIHPWCR